MAANYVITTEAGDDVADIAAWYERQTTGLGDRFLARFDDCVRAICAAPAAHQVIFKTYRKSLVKKFPYAVYYDFDGTTVTIYCVYHTARDPGGWQRRLP
jgi:plasmid stabilization system protein ParE